MKLFEYLAAGKPILASKLPSIQEAVSDNEVWFMNPENPIPDVQRFLTSTETEQIVEMTKQAAKRSARYSWNQRARSILEFLQRP
jgi:glycosyltransferase involved in cell wall biosynthesis